MKTQAVLDLFLISHVVCNFCTMGRGVDWAVQDVAQLRQWLVDGPKPREMRALRSDWSLESIKTKIKQLRRGAPDQSRPLKRRRTTEVLHVALDVGAPYAKISKRGASSPSVRHDSQRRTAWHD